MYQKTLTIKLHESSPLYQNLCAVAQQEGCSVGLILDKISAVGLYALLEKNLEFVVKHQYGRLPVQPLSQKQEAAQIMGLSPANSLQRFSAEKKG